MFQVSAIWGCLQFIENYVLKITAPILFLSHVIFSECHETLWPKNLMKIIKVYFLILK